MSNLFVANFALQLFVALVKATDAVDTAFGPAS